MQYGHGGGKYPSCNEISLLYSSLGQFATAGLLVQVED